MNKRSRLFDEFVLKSWWTILFFLICFFAYDQAAKRRALEEEKLCKKFHQLSFQKQTALIIQENLKREISSHNDEEWVELILMRKLGLVPEGQTKVHFIRARSK